ncbi:hypothetical protein T484DRAFT_1640664 [Baffinella frigidus]|nr:hypothetical protein T484DRAFT_1640664 [Cryptophyta sp. CCMP2293]
MFPDRRASCGRVPFTSPASFLTPNPPLNPQPSLLNSQPSPLTPAAAFKFSHHPCRTGLSFPDGEHITTPRPHETIKVADLPPAFDWYAFPSLTSLGQIETSDGTNFLTLLKNQHIPTFCGSCWAMATISAKTNKPLNLRHTPLTPKPHPDGQVLINCGGGGTCGGGDPGAAYKYMAKQGLPDETCQNYEAVNGKCAPFGLCETCDPNPFLPGTCSAVTSYNRYYADEYGSVGGADKMKAEIFARGPISCGVHVTDAFENYKGGVFETSFDPFVFLLDHEISVVGWGTDTTGQYWVGRNSWGSYWGEKGFFRIRMHKYPSPSHVDQTPV